MLVYTNSVWLCKWESLHEGCATGDGWKREMDVNGEKTGSTDKETWGWTSRPSLGTAIVCGDRKHSLHCDTKMRFAEQLLSCES